MPLSFKMMGISSRHGHESGRELVCKSSAGFTKESFENFNLLGAFVFNVLARNNADPVAFIEKLQYASGLTFAGRPAESGSGGALFAEAPNRLGAATASGRMKQQVKPQLRDSASPFCPRDRVARGELGSSRFPSAPKIRVGDFHQIRRAPVELLRRNLLAGDWFIA
jgi:hypothetical protein